MTQRLPVLFMGHGSPMNAIDDNSWSRALRSLGPGLATLPLRAAVVVSAHWWTRGTLVQASPRPETIHDFGGFPRELFEVRYEAPGDPDLASRLAADLGGSATEEWGLDHGAWSLLVHLFPDAKVPVVQVSLDAGLAPSGHLELGARLGAWRERGVLVVASGNATHNLHDAMGRMSRPDPATPDWASSFDRDLASALERRDSGWLLGALDTPEGRMSHPSPDHWLPWLWAFGATDPSDRLDFPVTGFDLGSLSMRSARWTSP
ncbi:MAG TPA: 4,5-DOPA dioxygenase extradiol [Fibrobacteria bacterium]|nr:4,5-DOPA dioxygenase extradiol [Fibrobacteria bacterium]HOX51765.1 4,5-DOPA dioxygenase extradiol [Fibrobacteria bacterium]